MDTIIRMEHVSKSYQLGLKSIQALKDLDFTAERWRVCGSHGTKRIG